MEHAHDTATSIRRTSSGTTGPSSTRRRGPTRSSATTRSSRRPASTARRRAVSSPTSTTRPARSAKIEGNPEHPASRGRNCAKGPATINQIYDNERILYPLKQMGERGSGEWERISWDQALDEIGGRIRTAFEEDRHNEVMYHVGRPGEDGYADRVLKAWGIDGHNSHTNICSLERPHRLPELDGPRPSVERLRQRRGHLPHLVAPRGRSLLQPARAAHHRGAGQGRHGHLRRPAPVEHRLEGRPLAADVARHRSLPVPVDRASAARERARGT